MRFWGMKRQKPLLRKTSSTELPFALDQSLREVFLGIDEYSFKDWSKDDWVSMAGRAIGEIKKRFNESSPFFERFWTFMFKA